METQFTIPALHQVYSSHQNYKVVSGNAKCRKKRVILFFSGNGLYYPNTPEVFDDIIVRQDRYEWENIARSLTADYHELIFIRDVYKTWYSEGISADYPSIEATLICLKELTKNAEYIVCVGNSAGGYAALLFGSLLKADAIFSFSGFVNLDEGIYNDPLNPKLKEASQNLQKKKWLDIRELLYASASEIFYFYPNYAEIDKKQHAYLKVSSKIVYIPIDSDLHGIGPSGKTCIQLFTRSLKTIKKRLCLISNNVVSVIQIDNQFNKRFSMKFDLRRWFT